MYARTTMYCIFPLRLLGESFYEFLLTLEFCVFDFMVDVMQSEEHRKAFGKRLKELRNQRRWTQKEVTAKIGLQLSQFNKYESGMHVPPADKLLQLAELFATTTDYLLMGTVSDAQPITNIRLLERFQALVQC